MVLTALKVKGAKPGRHVDGRVLCLLVKPSGARTWLLRMQKDSQLLLRKEDGETVLIASDNVLESAKTFLAPPTCAEVCTPEQHALVAQAIIGKVDNYSTSDGPDGGNLACVWAVRRIVHEVLGFWITRSDGTAVFDPALLKCFGSSQQENMILPGGIIISPTSGSKIGHMGLLGTGSGDARPVCSNSSDVAMLKRNFTVGSWREKYVGKGLPCALLSFAAV